MEHHENNDIVDTTQHNNEAPSEGTSNEDLYARDIQLSVEQSESGPISDQPNNTGDDTVAANYESATGSIPPVRQSSPPFEQPAAWEAIENAHGQRIANERASGIQWAKEQELRRLEQSLLYRRAMINTAMFKTKNNQWGCIIPSPWCMAGLRGDLVRHPYIFERYLDQENEILDLIRERMVRISGRKRKTHRAKGELKYLKKQISARRQSADAGDNKALMRGLLTAMMDQVLSDIENKVDKSSETTPISFIPFGLLELVDEDESLRDQLTTLSEIEREHFPWLFEHASPASLTQQSPTRHPACAVIPTFEKPALSSPQPSPEKSDVPPPSLQDLMDDAEHMVLKDIEILEMGYECVRGMPSVTEKMISSTLCKDLCAWPELKKRLEHLRNVELGIFPERFPPPVIYMARTSPTRHTQEPEDDYGQRSSSAPPQRQSPASEGPRRSPSPDEVCLAPSASDADQPRTPHNQGVQASTSAVQSPETAPSTSPTGATQTATDLTSVKTPTPIQSANATPLPPEAPASTPGLPEDTQGQGPLARNLSYRLEQEKRSSSDGVVQQVRFAERETLPGETPGESSSSRVNDWLVREYDMEENVDEDADNADDEMEDVADQHPEPQQESQTESQSQSEQHASETTDNHGEEREGDQEMAERDWDALTEEEKMERRDSAYKAGKFGEPRV